MTEAADWITDLNQAEWWQTPDDEKHISFDLVRAEDTRNPNNDENPTIELRAIVPVDDLRYLLEQHGFRFHAGSLGRWIHWDREELERDRTFVAEHGLDLYSTLLEAGHTAQRNIDNSETDAA